MNNAATTFFRLANPILDPLSALEFQPPKLAPEVTSFYLAEKQAFHEIARTWETPVTSRLLAKLCSLLEHPLERIGRALPDLEHQVGCYIWHCDEALERLDSSQTTLSNSFNGELPEPISEHFKRCSQRLEGTPPRTHRTARGDRGLGRCAI